MKLVQYWRTCLLLVVVRIIADIKFLVDPLGNALNLLTSTMIDKYIRDGSLCNDFIRILALRGGGGGLR